MFKRKLSTICTQLLRTHFLEVTISVSSLFTIQVKHHYETTAIIIVMALFVVVLIKIQSRKQESNLKKDFEQNDLEAGNSFSRGLSISHVEEDPFVDDFKENKLIDKI